MSIRRAAFFATFLLTAAAPAISATAPAYRADLTRYFTSDAAEAAARKALFAEIDAFAKEKPRHAAALEAYLDDAQRLLGGLDRHSDYLLLEASIDIHNRAAASAGDEVDAQSNRVRSSVEAILLRLPPGGFEAEVKQRPSLARAAYAVQQVRRAAAHTLPPDQQLAVDRLGEPALTDLYSLYTTTLRSTPFAKIAAPAGDLDARADRGKLLSEPDPAVRAAANKAFFEAYASREKIYAELLLSIVNTKTRIAKLEHFDSAPDAKYFSSFMSVADVKATLAAVAAQAGLNKRFEMLEANHAAAQSGLQTAHSWDVSAPPGGFSPPHFSIDQIRADAHAALRPLGDDYVNRMDALLDPANGRFDIASGDPNRDAGGFSAGAGGQITVLFIGNYDGMFDGARTMIHEGGHAIHREYMNSNHVPEFYTSGPHWMFEAFAILNEFLLEDHLVRASKDPAAKAYFLNALLKDMTFQLYGSAEEGTLEQAIYDGAGAGKIKSGEDLDALTQSVLSQYDIWPQDEPEQRHVWMTKTLMYMDPLYLVNYLYAGLLATKLYEMALEDPKDFQPRYTALLAGGFDAPPDVLLARFFGHKVTTADLIPGSVAVIGKKTDELEALYRTLDRKAP